MSHALCRDSARGRHGTRHRESRGTRRRASDGSVRPMAHQVSPGTAVEALWSTRATSTARSTSTTRRPRERAVAGGPRRLWGTISQSTINLESNWQLMCCSSLLLYPPPVPGVCCSPLASVLHDDMRHKPYVTIKYQRSHICPDVKNYFNQ